MCALIRRTLLCAATARAAATSEYVVDNFNTTDGMFTLTSQVPPVLVYLIWTRRFPPSRLARAPKNTTRTRSAS